MISWLMMVRSFEVDVEMIWPELLRLCRFSWLAKYPKEISPELLRVSKEFDWLKSIDWSPWISPELFSSSKVRIKLVRVAMSLELLR